VNGRIQRLVIGGVLAALIATSTATTVVAQQRRSGRARPRVDAARAKRIYIQEGCRDCHKVAGVPGGSTIGPDLSKVGREHTAAQIARKITNPKSDNPNSVMPAYKLNAADLKVLSDWLASLK